MKFWGIFRFEFRYQIRRPWPWLFFTVVFLLQFVMTRDGGFAEALYTEFFLNSPFAIAMTTVFGGLLWLLLAPPVAGDAAARDVGTGMYPLVYTTSIDRTEYLGGRFLAALTLNLLILLAVPLAILLAVTLPGVDPVMIGPFRADGYLTAFAYILLPNAFLGTAVQFALAVRTGRAMASYVGSVALVFMAFFVASLLLYKRGLGKLLDPVGVRFIWDELSHLWTTTEKNWRVLELEGSLLGNRLLWVAVALAALAIAYASFRFAHRVESDWWRRWARRGAARAPAPALAGVAGRPTAVPHAAQTFGFAIDAQKALAIAWASFRSITRSLPGLALLVGIPMITVLVVLDQTVVSGVQVVPTTARVIRELTGAISDEMSRWVVIPLAIVFFAGELVWRERDAGVAEITDATPGSEWAPIAGKFLGLGLVLALFTAMLAAAGMLAQLLLGYHQFEIGLYLRILFGLQLPEWLIFAVLALAAHVLMDQKYVGHLVAVLAYVFILVLAGMLGIEHKLLVYGTGPGMSYTEMRGFGPLGPWLWFKLYWAAWALLLAVVAKLFWVRGKETRLPVRMAMARRRLGPATVRVAGVAALVVMAVGGFVFYNTNVLNDYLSASEGAELRAEYERRYRRFETIPQPQLVGTRLRIEIQPRRRVADIRGSYRLVNASGQRIDSLHVAIPFGAVEARSLSFDRPAALVVNDATHGSRIYDLETPLAPGDSLELSFDMHVEPRGFTVGGADQSFATNGTYFTTAWFPFVGYQRTRELIHGAQRRKHGLEPRPILASLYETEGRGPAARRAGIAFEAVMGTDEGQVAVAPGALRRTWSENGRRYYHYSTDAPIGTDWAFFSARYAVREAMAKDVRIRIHHHPGHTAHVDRMMRSVQGSLDVYSREFGPYPYGHLTVIENPVATGTGAHADASMISHGQGWAHWIPKDARRADFPYAIMAHEVAHQWTVPYAMVEGLPFLAEGLATYFAMQAVRQNLGGEQLRLFLQTLRLPYPYPEIRRGEPLLRALDPYLSYRRGPFAMHALSEYVGRDEVNGALKWLIQRHDAPGAPEVTTLDLYRELKAVTPDSLHTLLADLFEVNTYWRLGATDATARQAGDGSWNVTLELRTRKDAYDSAGTRREVALDEWIDIGVFGEPAEGRGELSDPLYVAKHRVRSGEQRITVSVPRKPVLAGIDPYHLLDWQEEGDDDNIAKVVTAQ